MLSPVFNCVWLRPSTSIVVIYDVRAFRVNEQIITSQESMLAIEKKIEEYRLTVYMFTVMLKTESGVDQPEPEICNRCARLALGWRSAASRPAL